MEYSEFISISERQRKYIKSFHMHVYLPYYLLLLGRFVLFSYILILCRYKNTGYLSIYGLTENGLGSKEGKQVVLFLNISVLPLLFLPFICPFLHLKVCLFVLWLFFKSYLEYMLLCFCLLHRQVLWISEYCCPFISPQLLSPRIN